MALPKFSVFASCAAAVVALFAPGCDARPVVGGGYNVSINVVSDLVAGPEASLAKVEFLPGDISGLGGHSVAHTTERALSLGDPLVTGMTVAALKDVDAGTYTIRATLLRPDRSLLVGRDVVVHVTGNSGFTVFLTAACINVVCPNSGNSGNSACMSGTCVDPRCSTDTPEYCPPDLFCHSSSDCTRPPASCSTGACFEGVCVDEPKANACASTEYCAASGVCTPLTMLSMGTRPGDEARCNTVCTFSDPCRYGYYVCEGTGAPVCTPLSLRPHGAPCGAGMLCNAHGECVDAADAGGFDGSVVDATIADAGVDDASTMTLDAAATDGAILDATVASSFPLQITLEVGMGTGTVTSTPDGIACRTSGPTTTGMCSAIFDRHATVHLTAMPGGNTVFVGWDGACATAGSNPMCTVTINALTHVNARFAVAP